MGIFLLKIKDIKDKKFVVIQTPTGAELDHINIPYSELYDISSLLNSMEHFPLNTDIKFNKINIKRNQTSFSINVGTTQSYAATSNGVFEEIPSNIPRSVSYEFDLYMGKYLSRKIMEYVIPYINPKPLSTPPSVENTATDIKQEN